MFISRYSELVYSHSMRKEVYPQVLSYLDLCKKEKILSSELSEEKLGLFPELHARIAVLRNLNYVDENDVNTIKGRCGCFVGFFSIPFTHRVDSRSKCPHVD